MVSRIFQSLLALTLLTAGAVWADVDEGRLDAQREAFRKALLRAELGDWNGVRPHLDLLEDYPLRPDIGAAWLGSSLGPATDPEVGRFLDRHPDLGFTADLRYRWLRSLAKRKAWDGFLQVFESHYRDADDTELQCLALRGRIDSGRTDGVADSGVRIWMSAFSRPEECDPVFDYLSERGLLTDDLRRERIRLALEAGQIRLARYVARPLPEGDRRFIDLWASMRSDPARELSQRARFTDADRDGRIVVYGFRRLARLDAPAAARIWQQYEDFNLPAAERLEIERDIALSHARRFLPGARELIERQASRDPDSIVAQWRVRLALRDLDWAGALSAIDGLPEEEKQRTIWNYWLARSLDGIGEGEKAEAIFEKLAGNRDYYGFLAADRLGRSYVFEHQPANPNEEILASLAVRQDVIRSRELYMTGLYGRGRVEWRWILDRLDEQERAQASILAARWGWHSQAIITASGNGLMNDLDLRFPTPWRESFETLSRRASLEPSFAYGIARSESLFMTDVASRAGAVGLMQLMPATGKQTAKLAGISYRGTVTLTDPQSNITLGTTYLGKMLARFDGNQVLAAAAYNAGPHRISGWLPQDRQLPADVWVDSIPFRETRRYVRRVLESDTVFDWRMDGEHRRLSQRMPPVRPDSDTRSN